MKVTYKKYYCPLCGAESTQQTNHFGEIYVTCRTCGNDVLYCKEPEALEIMANRKQEKAIFHTYYYSLDKENDREVYAEFCEYMLNYFKYKLFDAISIGDMHNQSVEQRKRDNQVIILYDPAQFEGQYVSNIGRVHDWFEFMFPNRNVKAGYWLERIEE